MLADQQDGPRGRAAAHDIDSVVTALDGWRAAHRDIETDMTTLAIGSMVIGVSRGFAVGGGIWPRLNEYH